MTTHSKTGRLGIMSSASAKQAKDGPHASKQTASAISISHWVNKKECQGAIHYQSKNHLVSLRLVLLELRDCRPIHKDGGKNGQEWQQRNVVLEEAIALIPLEQIGKRAFDHKDGVEEPEIQLGIPESLVDDAIDLAMLEHSIDKHLPVVKGQLLWHQPLGLCNLKVALVRNESHVRVHEAHGQQPELAVLAGYAPKEVAVMNLPYHASKLELSSITAICRAFNEFFPELGVKNISREWFDKELPLGPKQVCIQILGSDDFETKSLLVIQRTRCPGLAKQEHVRRNLFQSVKLEVVMKERGNAEDWATKPSLAIAKGSGQDLTQSVHWEARLLRVVSRASETLDKSFSTREHGVHGELTTF